VDLGQDGPALRFRIVTLGGQRRAFSLEPEVWKVLEAMARAGNQRLGHLIEDLLAREPARNGAASLRLAALRWQTEALAKARRDNATLLRRVISAIPAPACALSSAQLILARNRPFRDLQATLTENPDDAAATRLILGAPLARIADALDADGGRAVSVPFVLRTREGATSSGHLNISNMPGEDGAAVFLCIVRPQPR
jgi:predicted DNA-binding ribbon-helix-helix protein